MIAYMGGTSTTSATCMNAGSTACTCSCWGCNGMQSYPIRQALDHPTEKEMRLMRLERWYAHKALLKSYRVAERGRKLLPALRYTLNGLKRFKPACRKPQLMFSKSGYLPKRIRGKRKDK